MKNILVLSTLSVLGMFVVISPANAGSCGSVNTSAFDSIIGVIDTNMPDFGFFQSMRKMNTINNVVSNINSACSIMDQLQSSGVGVSGVAGFASQFSGQLAQITSIISSANSIIDRANVTSADAAQAKAMLQNADNMSRQLLSLARTTADNLARSMEL